LAADRFNLNQFETSAILENMRKRLRQMIKDLFGTASGDGGKQPHRKAAMYAILGDLLFIMLPLVAISIVDVSSLILSFSVKNIKAEFN
jgi:hypothetical protein